MNPDLQNKIELEALKEYPLGADSESKRDKHIYLRCGFRDGAKFVTGILQDEIDELKRSNVNLFDTVCDFERGIECLQSDRTKLENQLSEANATIQSLKDEIDRLKICDAHATIFQMENTHLHTKLAEAKTKACIDHPCRETCSGWKQGYDKGQSEATEKYDHAMIELRSYDQILDEKNKEIQSLKDENKKFREALNQARSAIMPHRGYDIHFGMAINVIDEALTQKVEE